VGRGTLSNCTGKGEIWSNSKKKRKLRKEYEKVRMNEENDGGGVGTKKKQYRQVLRSEE